MSLKPCAGTCGGMITVSGQRKFCGPCADVIRTAADALRRARKRAERRAQRRAAQDCSNGGQL